jgi:hypothetical protein
MLKEDIMNLYAPAVIKKGGKWLIGFIKLDGEFREKGTIKKLSDVKELSSYMTLKKFLKIRGAPDGFQGKVLKKLGAESAYILDKPINLTKKEWELWWWAAFNDLCKKCLFDCKQSYRVEIHMCPFLRGESP